MDGELFRYEIVSRRAPRDMRFASRAGAIYSVDMLDQQQFELETRDALALCFLRCFSPQQRAFLVCHIAGALAQNFYSFNCPTILSLPLRAVYRGHISSHSDSTCYGSFRFTRQQLRRIVRAMQLDQDFLLSNGAKYSGEAILLTCLYYMHRPMTQDQAADFIGITCQPDVSRMFNFFLDYMERWHHLIANDPEDSLDKWAPFVGEFKRKIMFFHVPGVDTIRYSNVIGFVDGKLHRVARPSQRPEHSLLDVDTQRTVYNGYKKIHALKFQSVVAPNGMIIQLSGAYRGRIADSTALRHSGLNRMLQQLSQTAGEHCDVYGDSAYPILSNIAKAYGSRQAIRTAMFFFFFVLKCCTGTSGSKSRQNQCRVGLYECYA